MPRTIPHLALEKQLNQIKTKYKLGDLLDDMSDNSDEDDEDNDHSRRGKESDDEEISALKLQIQRLTDALMKLKDLSVMEKKEGEKRIKQLERENANLPVLEDKIAKLKEDVKKANERIEQLKEQLDDALGAEDMIEELSQKKLELEEVRPAPVFSLAFTNQLIHSSLIRSKFKNFNKLSKI